MTRTDARALAEALVVECRAAQLAADENAARAQDLHDALTDVLNLFRRQPDGTLAATTTNHQHTAWKDLL